MAEPTSSLSAWDLLSRVSDSLGSGLSPAGDELTRVREIVEDGYHQFLLPPILPGEKRPHRWTFLSPLASLTTVANTAAYDLPDNFGSLIGSFTYAAGVSSQKILLVGEQRIREANAEIVTSGYPRMAAIRPKTFGVGTGQRYQVVFYPTPNGAYVLSYRYDALWSRLFTGRGTGTAATINATAKTLTKAGAAFDTLGVVAGDKVILSAADGPNDGIYTVAARNSSTELALVESPGDDGAANYEVLPATIWCLGGAQHSACLRESCLAVAEARRDDTIGLHNGLFMRELQASVWRDRDNLSRNLGYIGDASDDEGQLPRPLVAYWYNGVKLTS